jgi:hypothetical protein
MSASDLRVPSLLTSNGHPTLFPSSTTSSSSSSASSLQQKTAASFNKCFTEIMTRPSSKTTDFSDSAINQIPTGSSSTTSSSSSSSSSSLEQRAATAVKRQLEESKERQLVFTSDSFDSDSDDDILTRELKKIRKPASNSNKENINEENIVNGTKICEELNKSLNEINFYPNYEKDVHCIPVEEFAPFAARLLQLKMLSSAVKSSQDGLVFIEEKVKIFFEEFRNVLLNNALTSRQAELTSIENRKNTMDPDDYLYENSRVQAHIDNLKDLKRNDYLTTLAQVLNLQGVPERNRKPTNYEHQAFRYVSAMLGSYYR